MIKNKYFFSKPKQGGQIKKYESKNQQKNPIRNALAPQTPSRILMSFAGDGVAERQRCKL